jgi:beta-glucosidase
VQSKERKYSSLTVSVHGWVLTFCYLLSPPPLIPVFRIPLMTSLNPNPPSQPFLWGTATASYQIEGAVSEDGRAPSIWDVFAHTPGKVERSETGDIACDHYHRYKDDIALMRELGVQAYRFSISWSRVIPEGHGKLNVAGLDFYDRLVDEILRTGITPFATLFHWDLPQALQERGGFANRDVCGWFSDYATRTASRLGDRVQHWIMLNEPSVYACLGHALGLHAPGVGDLSAFFAVTHHLNLAQGFALQALRSVDASWQLGTTLSIDRGVPVDHSEDSIAMAERHKDLWNRCFLGPLLSGNYPNHVMAELDPFIRAGDLESIRQPISFLGLNHYFRSHVRADPKALLGFTQVSPPAQLPRTHFDWEINPQEFRDTLLWVHQEYRCPPIYITENGAYFDDTVSEDGKVNDRQRIEFLDSYIRAMGEAMSQGVDVRGYFVWSLLDNFEWACGYRPTFGLVKVDFNNQRRIPKDSFYWYREQIQRHRK